MFYKKELNEMQLKLKILGDISIQLLKDKYVGKFGTTVAMGQLKKFKITNVQLSENGIEVCSNSECVFIPVWYQLKNVKITNK